MSRWISKEYDSVGDLADDYPMLPDLFKDEKLPFHNAHVDSYPDAGGEIFVIVLCDEEDNPDYSVSIEGKIVGGKVIDLGRDEGED